MFASERALLSTEISLAFTVFEARLPYHKIRIKSDLGLSDRAWCEPTLFGWLLHMGPVGFVSCARSNRIVTEGPRVDVVFIHELVHAWQGAHGLNYVVNSILDQCAATISGGSAYGYTSGAAWSSYGCEQQGDIVMDWYDPAIGNRRTTDRRFRYIRDNIRKGLIAP